MSVPFVIFPLPLPTLSLSLSVPLSSVSPCFLHPPLTLFSLLPLSLLQFFPPSSPHLSLLCLLLSPSLLLRFSPSSIFLSPLILYALQTYGYPRLYRRLLEYNRRNIIDRSRRRAIQDNVKFFFRIPNMIGRRFSMALWWVNVICAAS